MIGGKADQRLGWRSVWAANSALGSECIEIMSLMKFIAFVPSNLLQDIPIKISFFHCCR
jgi:hypothetical protein